MQSLTLILIQITTIICLIQAQWLYAATMASADASGGYAARVLDKVLTVWAPPPALKSNFEVRVKISIDGKGHLQECEPTRSSGLEALDTSACGSVKQVAPFASPPDGKPVEVHLVFWTGKPKGRFREQPPSPEEVMRAEIRARTRAESLIGKESASSAENEARQRAEAVAIKTGKQIPEIGEIPVAPPARSGKQLLVVPSRKNATYMDGKDNGNGQKTDSESAAMPEPDVALKIAQKDPGGSKASNINPGKQEAEKLNSLPEKKASDKPADSTDHPVGLRPAGQLPAEVEQKKEPKEAQVQDRITDQNGPMFLANSSSLPEINDSAYLRKIRSQIMKSTYLPAHAKPGEYHATVKLLLDGQGIIKDSAISGSSGSTMVDSHIMRGISRRNKVSPPPGGNPATCEIKIMLVHRNAVDHENTEHGKNSASGNGKAKSGQTGTDPANARPEQANPSAGKKAK